MFFVKGVVSLIFLFIIQLTFTESAWAWGPAIHTAIGTRILGDLGPILPTIGRTIQAFPLEYIYGSLAADFFIGKGQKKKDGHSHNWETGFRFVEEVKDNREAAYAYGFLSHLAADVIAHNYFVPNLIRSAPTWKRMGHLLCEVWADYSVHPVYMRIARDILSMEQLGCDELLRLAVGRKNGLKARKHLFTQSVKLSDFLIGSQYVFLDNKGLNYQTSHEDLEFMIDLSYRLVKDFLTHPDSSPCLSYDPIGTQNLRSARRIGIISKLLNIPQHYFQFAVDQELLNL